MADKEVRIGTTLWETSTANEDVKTRIISEKTSWTGDNQFPTRTFEFTPKTDCVVKINGYESTIPAYAEYQTDRSIETFIVVTSGVEFYLSMTF